MFSQNERLTEKKLSKKEFASMQRILLSIEDLTNRLCERLVEGLVSILFYDISVQYIGLLRRLATYLHTIRIETKK